MGFGLATDHYAVALDSVFGGESGRLRFALAALGQRLTWAFDAESFNGFALGDPAWYRLQDRPTWGRPLNLLFSSGGEGDLAARVAMIPWPCGEQAAGQLAELRRGGRPVGRLEQIRLGSHRGLYVGQPLEPLAQMRPRPGLRVVGRRVDGQSSNRVLVVPDAGRFLVFEHAGKDRMRWPGLRGRSVTRAEAQQAIESSKPAYRLRRLSQVFGGATLPPLWFDEETATHIDESAGVPLQEGQLTVGHLEWIFDQLESGVPEVETDPDNLEVRTLGDFLLDAIWSGVRRGIVQADEPADAPMRVRHAVTREVDRLLGSGSTDPMAIPPDATNTLAQVEGRRQVVRFGPGGLRRPVFGRTHIRDLHPDWRSRLCPLQTRESEDIGLVRHLAVPAFLSGHTIEVDPDQGVPEDWRDLSPAACLVPLLNHNDPTRAAIGSRILKQAVPVVGQEVPTVRTGFEGVLAEAAGVSRAPHAGKVVDCEPDAVTIAKPGGAATVVRFGPAQTGRPGATREWRCVVEVEDRVSRGQILAVAPDVTLEGDDPHVALGLNCVVAYTPWKGLNFEDAIVVSESLAERMASRHELVVTEPLRDTMAVVHSAPPGREVDRGDLLARIRQGDHPDESDDDAGTAPPIEVEIVSPVQGTVLGVVEGDDEVAIRLSVLRPLQVGDKLANRHGNKGVVSAILPVDDMPRLPDGSVVEVVLNPIGALRRLNLGQFFETHLGLLARLNGENAVPVGRRIDTVGLRRHLVDAGAPGGRVQLTLTDGTALDAADGQDRGVVAGVQYLIKLDHMADDKLAARYRGPRSVRSQQPLPGAFWSSGRKIGGPQRMGEMELWALQAVGSRHALEDVLVNRADRPPIGHPAGASPTFQSVLTHLLAAGFRAHFGLRGGRTITSDGPLHELAPADIETETWEVWDGHGLQPLVLEGELGIGAIRRIMTIGHPDRHPLYDRRHGGYLDEWRCPCGNESRRVTRCSSCGEVTSQVPSEQRYRVTHGIELAEPVPHPWYQGISASDGEEPPALRWLPLLPPTYRAFGRADPLDERYLWAVAANLRLATALERGERVEAARRALQDAVTQVVGLLDDPPERRSVAARLRGKLGLARRNLLGRATELSARGVIVPDPSLHPEEVGLPEHIFQQLRVGENLGRLPAAEDHSDVVILNRQPTLHPYNLVGLRGRRVEGAAIRIHPILCKAIAGDFDGDTVAIHRVVDPYAQRSAWEALRPAANLRSEANGRLLATLDLDIALGIRLLAETDQGRQRLQDHARSHGEGLAEGAPSAGALAEGCASLAPEQAVQCLADLIGLAFEAVTGWSASPIEHEALDPATAAELSAGELSAAVDALIPAGSALQQAIEAGAAGKPSGILQIYGVRRPAEGFDPQIASANPVPGNLWRGLPNDLFFASVNGGLAALGEKKLTTPQGGALTKALVEACYEVVISGEDCGLHGNSLSPITCRLADPCQACYGPMPGRGEPPPVGHRVGILAGMLIGERGTQLAMQAFHAGGTGARVGRRLDELRGLFGKGRFHLNDEPVRLYDLMTSTDSETDHQALLSRLLDVFVDLTSGEVDRVHGAVVLRRLAEVVPRREEGEKGALLDIAAGSGSPLTDTTTHGRLGLIAEAALSGRTHRFPQRRNKAALMMGSSWKEAS